MAMKKMRVSDLTGAALDWAVAKCEGKENCWGKSHLKPYEMHRGPAYSTDWVQGGEIMFREKIGVHPQHDGQWLANKLGMLVTRYGPHPLVAAMRCYVASKYGEHTDIPEELL